MDLNHPYLMDNPNMDDGEDSSDDEGDRDERIDVIEVDSPFEDEEEDDVLYDGVGEEYEPYEPGDSDVDTDGSEGSQSTDEDAMTWETLSNGSEQSVKREKDEWFPMAARNKQFPNFALPTATRSAICRQDSSRSCSPQSENTSEAEDVHFQNFLGVMRPEPSRHELLRVVLDYFLHYGHSEVVEIFCKEMKIPLPEKEIAEMNARNEIRDLIWAGRMDEAIEKMPPGILDDPDIHFAVRKQHIIEMIRAGQMTEPVTYFRKHLMTTAGRPEDERMIIIERVFTLMVFSPEDGSEFHQYLDQKEREATAKLVNSALLGKKGKSKASQIELMAKTMAYVRHEVFQKTNPGPASSAKLWADKYFNTPYGWQELIDKVTVDGLDDSRDLC